MPAEAAVTDVHFAYPGNLATLTGGYRYDRRVIDELRAMGLQVAPLSLGEALPGAPRGALEKAERRLAAIPGTAPIIVDGLALGVLPGAAERIAARRPLVALVHHPLAEESGLSPALAARLEASERAALAHARRVVVPSRPIARLLSTGYGVPADRIRVAEPGVDPAAPAAPGAAPPHRLLAVGSVVPRKGYDVLIEAIARLPARDIRLTVAGSLARDAGAVAALRRQVIAAGLADRVRLAGELAPDALDLEWRTADLFVIASRFEGYGMVVTEALARGLPVVGTDGGALAETIPADAGRTVPAGDAMALAAAIDGILEPAAFAAAAAAAAGRRGALPRWSETAAVFRDILKEGDAPWASTSTG